MSYFTPLRHMLIHDSYVYLFDEDKMTITTNNKIIDKIGTEILLSKRMIHEYSTKKYFGLSNAVQHIIKLQHEYPIYLIGPVYINDKQNGLADSQLSITGCPYYNEHFVTAAKRELSEEIGLTCDTSSLINIVDSYTTTYIVNINNTYSASKKDDLCQDTKNKLNKKDNKNKKIQVLIFGSLPEIETKIKQINYREDSADLHSIAGLRILSLDDYMTFI